MSSERIAFLQESIRQLNERLRAQGRTVIVEEGTDSKDLKVTFPQGRRPPPAKREEG